jgi:hypothetical protein
MRFRKFYEQVNGNNIYVDLDETLVKTQYLMNASNWLPIHNLSLENLADEFEKRGEKVIRFGSDPKNEWFVTRVRPHAHEFLNVLHGMGEVAILTTGGTEFQAQVVKLHDLPIKSVYGREQYGSLPKSPRSILIDDNWSMQSMGIESKIKAIGCGTDRVVVAPGWQGKDASDNGLMPLVPKIQQLLAVN